MSVERTCDFCEKPFFVSKRSRTKYCSEDCKKNAAKARREAKESEEAVPLMKEPLPSKPPTGDIAIYTNRTKRKDKPIYVKVLCTKCVIAQTGNRPGNYQIRGYQNLGSHYGECACGTKQPYNQEESPKMRAYVKLPTKDEVPLDDPDMIGAKWVWKQYANKGKEMAGM